MKKKRTQQQVFNRLLADVEMNRLIDRREGVLNLQKLNPQERMVTVAIWREYRDREIEKNLGMTRGSLRWSIESILKKLKRKTRVGIVLVFERALHKTNGKCSPWKRP